MIKQKKICLILGIILFNLKNLNFLLILSGFHKNITQKKQIVPNKKKKKKKKNKKKYKKK
jgi:hypothetical protein